MYIRIVIIFARYSGYAYNIILLCTLINNNTLHLYWLQVVDGYRLRYYYIGINGVCLRCRRNSEIHDADRANIHSIHLYIINLYIVHRCQPYTCTLIYIVLKT